MGKNHKDTYFISSLAQWFDRQKRVLPWRSRPTCYRVWVSEIMLQQTRVETVLPFFQKFVSKFPNVKSLSEAPLQEVMKAWAGLGYYSRARNLHRGAQQIHQRGRFPKTREDWLQIPGVGSYTAGAILSIALDQAEAILDGNVERVLSRVYRIGDSKNKKDLWERSENLVKRADQLGIRPSIFNQALMELGALICIPKAPRCEKCPIQKKCQAFCHHQISEYPVKKKVQPWKEVKEVSHCILDAQDRILLVKKTEGKWRRDLWDVPSESELQQVDVDFKLKGRSTLVARFEIRYVVTRHKVLRQAYVWKTNMRQWKLKDKTSQGNWSWQTLGTVEVPMGAPLKKLLLKIQEIDEHS